MRGGVGGEEEGEGEEGKRHEGRSGRRGGGRGGEEGGRRRGMRGRRGMLCIHCKPKIGLAVPYQSRKDDTYTDVCRSCCHGDHITLTSAHMLRPPSLACPSVLSSMFPALMSR